MNILTIHFIIFFVFMAYIYRKTIETMRLKALYDLYNVRDRLVYLVASDITDEDNKLFSYYYHRVNVFLKFAPNVGLENLLRQLSRDSASVEESIAKAKEELKIIFSDELMKNDEVIKIIEDYYSGVGALVLSHSDILKVGYYLAERYNPFYKLAEWILKNFPLQDMFTFPVTYLDAYRVTKFVNREAYYVHKKYKHHQLSTT